MKQRVITGVCLGLIFGLIYFLLPLWCAVLIFGLLAALGVRELLLTTGAMGQHPLVSLSMGAALLVAPVTVWGQSWHLLALVFVYMVCVFACGVFDHTRVRFAAMAKAFLAAIILPCMLTSAVRILALLTQALGQGPLTGLLALLPWFTVWVCDSAALFVGKAFGKRKLAPYVSPKKTVAGFVGGMAGGLLVTLVYLLVLRSMVVALTPLLWALMLAFGVIAPALGQLGDLSLSVIKRETGIKDYGKLLPGHGGVYDRFDSILFVAPLFELVLRALGI